MSPSHSPAGNRVGLCLSITVVIKYLQRLTGHFRQARSEPHRLFLGQEETELGKRRAQRYGQPLGGKGGDSSRMLSRGLRQHLTWGLGPNHQEKVPRAVSQLGRYSGPVPMSSATQRKWQGHEPVCREHSKGAPPPKLPAGLALQSGTDTTFLLTKIIQKHHLEGRVAHRDLCILGWPHTHHAGRNDLQLLIHLLPLLEC